MDGDGWSQSTAPYGWSSYPHTALAKVTMTPMSFGEGSSPSQGQHAALTLSTAFGGEIGRAHV